MQCWRYTQGPKEFTMGLPLDADVRAKEIGFSCASQQVSIRVRGKEVLKGVFQHPVKPDDSTFEIESGKDGKQMLVTFCKARANRDWDCLFMDEVDDSITVRCFMDISVAGRDAGRVVYGLYGNACPKTVENFRCLCTGERGSSLSKKSSLRLYYKGCTFHRVLPGFTCQGGDLTKDPHGTGGCSIYGEIFDDENFKIKHSGEGNLLMASFGMYNHNHSQFCVALSKITEFETKHVHFGKVLEGMDIFRQRSFGSSAARYTFTRFTDTI